MRAVAQIAGEMRTHQDHRHATAAGIEGELAVPLAAFTFAHDGPRIDTPPPTLGQHNEEIFAELGQGSAPRKTAAMRS